MAASTRCVARSPKPPGGGSLRVEGSAEAAEEEHRRCETSGLVLCFRAANVVVAFGHEADPRGLAGLGAAIRAMESG